MKYNTSVKTVQINEYNIINRNQIDKIKNINLSKLTDLFITNKNIPLILNPSMPLSKAINVCELIGYMKNIKNYQQTELLAEFDLFEKQKTSLDDIIKFIPRWYIDYHNTTKNISICVDCFTKKVLNDEFYMGFLQSHHIYQ
ncbi:MAG: hypothetical protein PHD05_00420 [Sphaerochaetaceae bacterium]|nr:hypothetical protein [Sphaerochaetaceae bacterium]